MINVLKAGGEKEEFSEEKLKASIKRAKIPDSLQNQVLNHVKSKLYEGIPTAQIYQHVVEFLGTSSQPFSSTSYGLKQAIMQFGPTGYPFEDFVAEIFKRQGYQVGVRKILLGKCISHEVDIVAKNSNGRYMVECKFHNSSGTRSDVHVSLYTKARFDDLKEKNNFSEAFLITNTKVTSDALSYAECSRVNVISWDYPQGESLRDLIERFSLHPITILTTLSQNQKQVLLENHIVLCKQIKQNPESIEVLNLPQKKLDQVLAEAKFSCSL